MSQLIASIDMTLDLKSVNAALRKVDGIIDRKETVMKYLIEYFSKRGEEVAKAFLYEFDPDAVRTGALSDSIKHESKGSEGKITAGEGLTNAMGEPTNYAIFVEFGNRVTHPDGWWYPDKNGTYKPKEGNQSFSFTRGMAPRPFMHKTYELLYEEIEREGGVIAAQYIRGER